MNQLINFILTSGIVVTVIIIVMLLRQKSKPLSRKILGLIFLLLLFVVIYSYGEYHEINWMKYIGFVITDSIGYLIGPLLLFYVVSIFESQKIKFKILIKHFIPAIIYIAIISIPFLISFYKESLILPHLSFLVKNNYLLQFQGIYLIIYVIVALKILRVYQNSLKNHFSTLNKKDFKWIQFLLISIILVLLTHFSIEIFNIITDSYHFRNIQGVTLVLIFAIIYLGYFGTNQSQILLPKSDTIKIKSSKNSTTNHHLVNASEIEIQNLKNRLHSVLKNDKPYTNENLTLGTLAKLIPTSDRKLSALLNHYLNTSFYDLINHYRVENVKEKIVMPEYKKYTLMAIAYDSGFNSKTTFNRIFKKETGLSPSKYKKLNS